MILYFYNRSFDLLTVTNMNSCCQTLLVKIAELYKTTPEEILRSLERPKCSWIYKKATKDYKTGERCQQPVMGDNYVFCQNHHAQGPAGSNCFTVGPNAHREVYYPNVGKVQYVRSGNTTVANLVQGDMAKFQQAIQAQQGTAQAAITSS